MTEIVPVDETPLDHAAVRNVLIRLDGNVTKAALELGLEPERLRALARRNAALAAAIEETMERAVDQAVDVMFEALRDQASFLNRYYAAKEFLRSEAGRRRGFGPPTREASVEIKTGTGAGGGAITLKWLEPLD
jgi:hypothetical protein